VTAPTRRGDAAHPTVDVRSEQAQDLWREAVGIRRMWLRQGLSTRPADRPTAERSLTAIYAKAARPRPRFVWVDSPRQAMEHVAGWTTLADLAARLPDPCRPWPPPRAGDVATLVTWLRGALDASIDPELSPYRPKGRDHKPKGQKDRGQRDKGREPWPEMPPLEALRSGVPLGAVLHQGVQGGLHRSLSHGLRAQILGGLGDGPVPVCWYGQHDAAWIAYYDVLHRLGLVRFRPAEHDHLGHWAALARSCGWWWPGEEVCVVTERPELVQTEPVPGAWHEEVRLRPGGVRYRDGWSPAPNDGADPASWPAAGRVAA
jgi:hypothetical protein